MYVCMYTYVERHTHALTCKHNTTHARTHTHQFVLGQELQQSDELDAIREVLVKVIDLHASLQ